MTTPMTPTWKPSHKARNAWIGLILVMVVLAGFGAAASRQENTGPGVPAGQSSPDAGATAGDDEGSPAPIGTTPLLTFKGTGAGSSESFHASGDSVDVTSDYTCPADGTFSIDFYGTNESPLLPDNVFTSDFGTSGSNTTPENLNGTSGPFHVEIDSTCDWSVEVLGTP